MSGRQVRRTTREATCRRAAASRRGRDTDRTRNARFGAPPRSNRRRTRRARGTSARIGSTTRRVWSSGQTAGQQAGTSSHRPLVAPPPNDREPGPTISDNLRASKPGADTRSRVLSLGDDERGRVDRPVACRARDRSSRQPRRRRRAVVTRRPQRRSVYGRALGRRVAARPRPVRASRFRRRLSAVGARHGVAARVGARRRAHRGVGDGQSRPGRVDGHATLALGCGARPRQTLLAALLLCAASLRTLNQFSILAFALALAGAASPSRLAGGVLLGLSLFKPQIGGALALWVWLRGQRGRVLIGVAVVLALCGSSSARVPASVALDVAREYAASLSRTYTDLSNIPGHTDLRSALTLYARSLDPGLSLSLALVCPAARASGCRSVAIARRAAGLAISRSPRSVASSRSSPRATSRTIFSFSCRSSSRGGCLHSR